MKDKLKPIMLHVKDQTTYLEQEPINSTFELSTLWIVGYFIKEDKEKIILAMEYHFNEKGEDSVRYTTSVQKSEVLERIKLKR